MSIVMALPLVACGDSREDNPFEPGPADSGITAGDTDGGGSASGGGNSGSASESGDSDGPSPTGGDDDDIRYDVGAPDDGLDGKGCEKIDFLFVVDNSGSMGAHQTALINSFGPFMDTIFSTVNAKDYHIMVADSDADQNLRSCEPCPWDSSYCGDYCDIRHTLHACEGRLGAGQTGPYNNQASNRDCGVPGGVRYLTSGLSQAEIKEKFACMAKVGIFGSGGEMPMSAMVEAVTTQAAPGACNDGFLRDDAVLVVTVISDDYPSSNNDDAKVGIPQVWYDGLVEAKKGTPNNIVMLGIINLESSTCISEGSAGPGPVVHPTERFVELVDMFGIRGVKGDICARPDYSAFFAQAVSVIDTACDEFVPPG